MTEHKPAEINQDALRVALNWALDEIDALSNKLVQFGYPQGILMLDREDQAEGYWNACDARRALDEWRCPKCGVQADERWNCCEVHPEAALPQEGAAVAPVALPIETYKKDGTIVRLLVEYDHNDMGSSPLEDSAEPSWTIGMNQFDHTGDDEWFLAGWSWEQDCFTDSTGKVIGWLPFHAPAPAPSPAAGVDAVQVAALAEREAKPAAWVIPRAQPDEDGFILAVVQRNCEFRKPLYDHPPAEDPDATRQGDVRIALEEMTIAFAEGVDWTNEQRVAYENAGKVLAAVRARPLPCP